jgi:hypothetical protein
VILAGQAVIQDLLYKYLPLPHDEQKYVSPEQVKQDESHCLQVEGNDEVVVVPDGHDE